MQTSQNNLRHINRGEKKGEISFSLGCVRGRTVRIVIWIKILNEPSNGKRTKIIFKHRFVRMGGCCGQREGAKLNGKEELFLFNYF